MPLKSRINVVVASLAFAAVTTAAQATPFTFTGSGVGPGAVPVSAQAIFDITGNTLTITLINNAPSNSGQDVPGSTLSGLFWDFTGNPLLTPVSATVASGSIVSAACSPASCVGVTNVGGEFGYQVTSFPGGADRGISSSGYVATGLPGNIGNFNNGSAGTNLDNPNSLNGINFGIISAAAGFNPNGGLVNDPLIQDRAVFVLTGVNGLTYADVSDVSFQYGTSLTELRITGNCTAGCLPPPGPELIPQIVQVSEPALPLIFATGVLAWAATRRRVLVPAAS